ncbi:MAG: hypothetical protein K2O14_11835 [Oscillospiraceae bacterium]|nr:hypothetical protein [Oscillospiraceae bacterium]
MDENRTTSTNMEQNTTAQPPKRISDNSSKNAMSLWGLIILVFGGLTGFVITMILSTDGGSAWIYGVFIMIVTVTLGLILLGISAVVDRLNTIIKLLKENKQG